MVTTDQQKIKEVLNRGVSEVIVKEDLEKKLLSGKKLRVYYGIDPTGSLLHLGHAVVLRKLRDFAGLGHEVILLIGDFTAKIGDPSGRDATRAPLSDKQIKENMKDYKKQASKILDFSKVKIKYNSKWLSELKFADILELSSHITVQQMLHREMFKSRMSFILSCPKCGKEFFMPAVLSDDKKVFNSIIPGKDIRFVCNNGHEIFGLEEGTKWKILNPPAPVGMHEFLYPLMQGYDSVAMDVDLEIGGNDQMFNMLIGRDLQKDYNRKYKDIVTTKLLLGTDGRKMSKTYNNAIYLNDSPKDMYGKVMSIPDGLITNYVELCTNLDLQEIQKIPNPRDQKAILAKEIVKMYHGEKEAQKAEDEFNKTFKDKNPTFIDFSVDEMEIFYPELISRIAGVSASEAKRLIIAGAVEINNIVDKEWKKKLDINEEGIKVKVGKRIFFKVKLK